MRYKMKKTIFFGSLAVAGLAAGLVSAGTLDDVKARGTLNCGVSTGVPGFAQPDANGVWQGLMLLYVARLPRQFWAIQTLYNSYQQQAKHVLLLWLLAK